MPIDVEAAVLANARLSPAYNIITLHAPEIAAQAQPGQFVMVRPASHWDPLLRRPFSIFEVVRGEAGEPVGITLLNKPIGTGTRLLMGLREGDRIACLGPLGKRFPALDPPSTAWMIAGGVGLAAFATLAEDLAARGTSATLFYGGRTGADLVCLDLFERLGARLELATEDGSHGARGFITIAVERALREATDDRQVLYCCGPTAMMKAVAALAQRFRRRCYVSLEQVMGCGLGGCYSCVVAVRAGTRGHFVRSCIEGPVFEADAILWDQQEGH